MKIIIPRKSFAALLILMVAACHDKSDLLPATGKISFSFTHQLDGLPLETDVIKYVNAAGNPYGINQLMYFISDVTLYKSDGNRRLISDWTDIHYVDIDMPETLQWDVYDDIATGAYDSITFVFGITEEKNQSFRFVNPPEVNMMWPEMLGGGYHYMMMNGKWRDNQNVVNNVAFHMGIGQLYKSNVIDTDSIYAFVQNFFTVSLPAAQFVIEENKTRQVEIIMNIESWFETPHIYDHNLWGGMIMQNQPAMQMAKENGFDVFSVGEIR